MLVVVRTQDRPKNHTPSGVYNPFLVLIITMFPRDGFLVGVIVGGRGKQNAHVGRHASGF